MTSYDDVEREATHDWLDERAGLPDPDEYLDWHIDQRADAGDRLSDLWRGWPIDDYNPDDREPMGGDHQWAEDLWD
jgi:hypothetical protein